jgi:hypothetical protein
MATWEYATTAIRPNLPTSATGTATGARDEPFALSWAGTGPDGESLTGLSAILQAWDDAGWELVTLTYQPVDLTLDRDDVPAHPVESTVTVADLQIAVFRRAWTA